MSLGATAPRRHGATAHAAQVTATWTGAGGNAFWNNANNWSTPDYPNNGTPAGTTYNVVIDGNSGATANVSLNVIVAIDALSVNSGDSLTVGDNQTITVVNGGAGTGTIANAGTIALNSLGNTTRLIINGDVTLNGGGTVTMSNTTANRILGTAATDRLTNVDNTIQGAGQIGFDAMALTNQGTIVANLSNSLTIDPSDSGAINTGTLRAINGGTLVLQNGDFANTGGTINAQAASFVDLTGANITGGTLNSAGSGAVRNIGTSTLANLTNAGNFIAIDNTTTNVVGTFANTGTIALNSLGNTTRLIINGDVTLNGGGTITMSNTLANRIVGAVATNRLTNVDNTIQGAGNIGVNAMVFANAGTIRANQSNALLIDVTGANSFTTAGTVQVLAGSTLALSGANFNQSAGRTSINGTLAANGGLTSIQGGTLDGIGTINGNVSNAGTVAPGTSPGVLTINGNYLQTAAGTLLIEIGGPAVGSEFDRLVVTGNAVLNGALKIRLLGFYTPAAGTNFQVVNYASRTGTMALSVIDADSRGGFTQNYNATDLTLRATGPDFGVVVNTNNSGPGSLRQVILDTNAQANVGGPDQIKFDIPAADAGCDSNGVCTIAVATALPIITDAVVIDGYTQSGATPNTNPVGQGLNSVLKIVLDGNAITTNARGLEIKSGAATVRGLVITRWRFGAVRFITGNGNALEGCYLGTTADGSAATLVSGANGVGVDTRSSTGNTIGGLTPAARNLIAGTSVGVALQDDNNRVLGNLIGTNRSGTAIIANTVGISAFFGGGNVIGAPGAGNVIAGSVATSGFATGNGIVLSRSNDNVIAANIIGLNVDGSAALPNAVNGILVNDTSSNNTIGGTTAAARNLISGNGGSGILINGSGSVGGPPPAQNNTVQGNFIGTDPAGSAALPNGGEGVEIYNSSNNTVGGTSATTGQAPGNLIAGNGGVGVEIATGSGTPAASPSNNNIVRGNLIGTNLSGSAAIPNGESGVLIEDDSSSNSIGGTDAGAGNLISGNAANGIALFSETNGDIPNANLIQGNRIGTNLAGTSAIANGRDGISVSVARGTQIGGAVAARNLISGNARSGIHLSDAAGGSTIQRNFIGTKIDGTTALGNVSHGILAIGSGPNAIGNTLGNPAVTDAGNVIAFNGGDGVTVVFANQLSFFKGILGNSIHSNGGLGIDLENDGVTANDVGDADIGANDLQNYPVLIGANSVGGATVVRGTLNSEASTEYRIELFTNDVADPTGFGEGRTFLAFQNVTSDSAGNLAFTFSSSVDLSGQFLTATATDPSGNTSEFSRALVSGAGPAFSIADAAPVNEGNSGQANVASFTITLAAASAQETRVTYETQSGTATENVDFVRKAELLIFTPGETSKTIAVPIIGDTIAEGLETFKVQLSAPTNATLNATASSATGTIIDDETAALTLSITPTTFSENAGAMAATGTITRNTATTTALTVTLSSSNTDKVTVPASVEIPAGQTSVQVALSAVDNTLVDGSKTVTITASRAGLTSATADVTVTDNDVASTNTPPVANAQSLSTQKNTPLQLALSGSDAETPAANLTFRITTPPQNGVLSGTALNLIYTPRADFVGADSFKFVVNDGTIDSAPATITLQVLAAPPTNTPPMANSQNLSTQQNTPLKIVLSGSDAETVAADLTFRLVTRPTKGTLSGTALNLTYTPNNDFVGADSFTFVANDGTVDSAPATIALQVLADAPVNTPPTANAQSLMTKQNVPLKLVLSGSDAETAAANLTFRIVSGPQNGTLSGSALNLTYTPKTDFTGADSFKFVVNDGTVDSAPATITLQVLAVAPTNAPPVAQNQNLRTDKATPLLFALTATDADVPAQTLTFRLATRPKNGTLAGSAARLTYTPNADFVGSDSFTFIANDGTVDSNTATITLQVLAVSGGNRPPVAPNQGLRVDKSTPQLFTLRASDPDNDALTYFVGKDLPGSMRPADKGVLPRFGTLSGKAPNLTYTPRAGFVGRDVFTFYVSDGQANSGQARVDILVSTQPLISAANDSFSLIYGAPAQTQSNGVTLLDSGIFRIAAPGVLANDRGRAGVTLTAKLAQNPRHGRIKVNTDGGFDYQPNNGFVGTDEFAYTLSDGTNSTNARVRLIVIDRRAPELRFDKPEVRFSTPGNGETVPSVTEIRGRVRDRQSDVKSMSLLWRRLGDGAFWNGSEWTSSAINLPLKVEGTFWKYEGALPEVGTDRTSDLLDGDYAMRATAIDNSGNISRLVIEFTVDNAAPAAPDFSAVRLSSAGASAEQGAIALRFTGALNADSASDTMNYALSVNGVEVESVEANYAGNVVTLSGIELSADDAIELRADGLRDTTGKALRGGMIQLIAR